MPYVIKEKENGQIVGFFDEKKTFFKKIIHAKTCFENHDLFDENDLLVTDKYKFFEIVQIKSSIYILLYFIKNSFKSFIFNFKYNKIYFIDKIFKTNLQEKFGFLYK